MNKPDKCKNCQWYGKPYWSIINPCDHCPNDGVQDVSGYTRITIPLISEEELKQFDKNLHSIIEEYSKMALHEKDQILIQRIIIKQEKEIEQLKKDNENLKQDIIILEKYLELIHDLGYDYDGLKHEYELKGLIDEMVRFASLGRAYNTTNGIYVDGKGKSLNILGEELKEDNE